MVIQGAYTSALPAFSGIPASTVAPDIARTIAEEVLGVPADGWGYGGPSPLPGCFSPLAPLPIAPGFDPSSAAALVQALRGASPFGPGALPAGAACGGSPYGQLGGLGPYLAQLQGLMGPGAAGAAGGGAMSVRDAATVLQQNFDQCSEKGKFGASITKKSLEKVVGSDTASPELKAAANAMLSNPQALEVLKKANGSDGLAGGVTKQDLNTALSPGNTTLNGLDALNPANLPPGSEQHALATIRKHWDQVGTGKFGTASKGDLQRILGSDSAPPELKQAVSQVLNTPGLYDRLVNAQGDAPFGISKADVNTLLAR